MSSRRAHGSLESSVLRHLWAASVPQNSRDIRAALAADGEELAATTVLTVLSRLEKKGLVSRDRSARAFLATRTDPDATADSMAEVLGRASDRTAVLQRFTGALGVDDLRALREALDAAGVGVGVGAEAEADHARVDPTDA